MARSIERFGERGTPLVMVNERYCSAMGGSRGCREGGVLRLLAHSTSSDRATDPGHPGGAEGSTRIHNDSENAPMKTAALVIGLVLLALGVACFIPGLATD